MARRIAEATGASNAEAERLRRERVTIARAKDLLGKLIDAAIEAAPALLAGAIGDDDSARRLTDGALDYLRRNGGKLP